ncbi:MAG TPA: M28 family peptidase [Caulobacteraceae bacterium]|nr:M28 family peptidase [Caulobacteraceae bacterium]
MAAGVPALQVAAQEGPTALRAQAEALRDRAAGDPTAYDFVTDLTTEVGPRLVGTPGYRRSIDWAQARLKALGFVDVHAEPFTTKAWLRGEERAELTAPRAQPLHILGLGGSVATPPGGVEGEVVVFGAYADLLAAAPGSLAGKIVVVNQPMVRAQDGSGYGAARLIRSDGPSQAARRGAIGYLLRSLDTHESRAPHTGALEYAADAPRIPAAALSTEDADLIGRLARSGAPLRLRLALASTPLPAAQAWNVVGEIRGSERPDEIILVGGHLDSWDPGTGAIDDGAGMAITLGAAHLIASGPVRPKRTIRVVLFGAEEFGNAGEAYLAAHRAEVPHIVLAAESDEGADATWDVQLPAGAAAKPAFASVRALLAPLKVDLDPQPSRFSGEDVGPLNLAGVPAVSVRPDASRYFQWHHSADDTLDKVDRVQLDQSVAVWTLVLWLAAQSGEEFRPPAK